MSETSSITDPFEHAIQSNFRVPDIDELDHDQQLSLLQGPGAVLLPVDWITDIDSFEEFDKVPSHMRLLNNFFLQFTLDRYNDSLPDDFKGIYVPRKATRRFQIMFPEPYHGVDEALSVHLMPNGINVDTDSLDRDKAALKKLYVAYKYARQLVDSRDDENIGPSYLTS